MDHSQAWRWRLMRLLWFCAAILVAVSAITYGIAYAMAGTPNAEIWNEVHENLSLGVERNLPSWFATILWGGFGLAAWYHSTTSSGRRTAWLVMAGVGWVASIDEYVMLHERLGKPAGAIEQILGIDLGGATWILGGGLVALITAGLLGRLVLGLPREARRDVIVGAGLFLLGAIGFEFVSVTAAEVRGSIDWFVMVTYHIEEALEYAGLILATRGILRVIEPVG